MANVPYKRSMCTIFACCAFSPTGRPQTNIWQSRAPAHPLFRPIHLAQRHHGDNHSPFAQQAPHHHHIFRTSKMQTRPTCDRRVALPLAVTMPQTPPARHQEPVQSTGSSPERPPYFQVPSPILYDPHLTALRPTWYREHHLSDLPLEMQVSATSREEYRHPRNETCESAPYGAGCEYHLYGSVPGTRVSAISREDYRHSPAVPVVNLPPSHARGERQGDMRTHRGAHVQYQGPAHDQRSHAPIPPFTSQWYSHSPYPHPDRCQRSTQQPLGSNQSHYGPPATYPQNHQAYHTNHQTHPLPARPPLPSNIHDPIYQSYPFRLLPLLHHPYPRSTLPGSAPLPARSATAADSAFRQQRPALSENWRERPRHLQDQQKHRQSR